MELDVKVPKVNPEARLVGATHGEEEVTHRLVKFMLLIPTLTTLM